MNERDNVNQRVHELFMRTRICRHEVLRMILERDLFLILRAHAHGKEIRLQQLLTGCEALITFGEEQGLINSEVISEIVISELNDEENSDPDEGDLNSEVRQRVLLQKIENLGKEGANCGIGELLAFFPDVTDRTLRSDLKKLQEKGLIVRIGNRGPNTAYRIVIK